MPSRLGFAPHVIGAVEKRDLSTTVLGQDVSLPVVISPTGVGVVLGELIQVSVLVQILAQQPVGVLVGAALPGMVRVAEEHRHRQRRSNRGVVGISRPRSQVKDRRRCTGRRPICSINARATASALRPSGSATTIA